MAAGLLLLLGEPPTGFATSAASGCSRITKRSLNRRSPALFFPASLTGVWRSNSCMALVPPDANDPRTPFYRDPSSGITGALWAPAGDRIVAETGGDETVRLFDADGVPRGSLPGVALGFFRDGTLLIERRGSVVELRDRKAKLIASNTEINAAAGFTAQSFRSAATGLTNSSTYSTRVSFVVHRSAPHFRDRVLVLDETGAVQPAGPLITENGDFDDANIGESWSPDGNRLFEFTVRVGHRFEHETCLAVWTVTRGYQRRFCSEHTPYGALLGGMDVVQWAANGKTALTNHLHVVTATGVLTAKHYHGENAAFRVIWSPGGS
jgi:WD40 repeat protein